ncbi:MAG: hypothetical protein RSB77_02550 [Bacilli bacterium]
MKAKDTLNIISKQWCNLEDLMTLAQIGKNKALKLRSEFKKELEYDGYVLPKNLLPMCEVVSRLKINITYLQKMSKQEY